MQESALFELAMNDLDNIETNIIEPLEALLSTFCDLYDYESFMKLVDQLALAKKDLEKLVKNISIYLDPEIISKAEFEEIGQRLEDIAGNFDFIALTVRNVIDSELFEIKFQQMLEKESEQGSENGE